MNKLLRKGLKIIAINECRMESDWDDETLGDVCLTIGKRYRILYIGSDELVVKDDFGDDHYFGLEEIHKFFKFLNINYKIL